MSFNPNLDFDAKSFMSHIPANEYNRNQCNYVFIVHINDRCSVSILLYTKAGPHQLRSLTFVKGYG